MILASDFQKPVLASSVLVSVGAYAETRVTVLAACWVFKSKTSGSGVR